MKFKLKKINSIRKIPYDGKVYDLTVEKDHSYNINGVIVHNSVCETRIRTGVGVPQFTALQEVVKTLDTLYPDVVVISDGGVKTPGDVAKAIGAGADLVMTGSLFAGTKETPLPMRRVGLWPNEELYKEYYGSASASNGSTSNIEGNATLVKYKGHADRIFNDIATGLRSAMSYVGATNINEFRAMCEFVEVTSHGALEAKPYLLLNK